MDVNRAQWGMDSVMIGSETITPTLARARRRAMAGSFKEAVGRFSLKRGALFIQKDGKLQVEGSFGFPRVDSSDELPLRWNLIQECFASRELVELSESDHRIICIPIKQPPEGTVQGLFYFDNDVEKHRILADELVSIEALAGRTGAELAVLNKRLLSVKERVLPTSDQLEHWSGIRRAGLEAFKAGVLEMAQSFLERAKEAAEEWGPSRELARSLNDYGEVLRANKFLDDAMYQFQRGLSILEQAGLDRELMAIPLLNNLGGTLHAKGDLTEAERLYRVGLDIMSDLDQENRATPAIMANLGVISAEMGDRATAELWLRQALASAIRMFGEDHPNTIKCREKLESL